MSFVCKRGFAVTVVLFLFLFLFYLMLTFIKVSHDRENIAFVAGGIV